MIGLVALLRSRVATAAIFSFILVAVGGGAHIRANPITVRVVPSSAPNFFGSPSFSGYNANALNSLENNLGNIGSRATDPTAYEVAGPVVFPGDLIVSSFPSWRGIVSPPAPFASEFGNRLHFGLHVLGNGTQFKLDNLAFDLDSTDSFDVLDFSGNFTGASFNQFRRGIDYVDGIKGNGNDIIYTSGPGTALIDELVYVGVGNAIVPFGAGTNQDMMNNAIAFLIGESPFTITTTYTIFADDKTTELASGSATVTVLTPEPASLAIWSLIGLGGAAYGWRRKNKTPTSKKNRQRDPV